MDDHFINNIIERLEQEQNLQFSFSEEQILEAFFRHIDSSKNWTMKNLAYHAKISMASISRLINKLEKQSYKEMQLWLFNFYTETTATLLLSSDIDANSLCQKLNELEAITTSNLQHFIKELKQSQLETFLNILSTSTFTMVLSVGFSQFASDYLAYSLQLKGLHIQSISMNLPSEIYWKLLKQCSLLIVISRSAATTSIKKKIDEAQAFNIPMVTITSNSQGIYAQQAKIVIPIYDRDPHNSMDAYSGFQLKLFYLVDIISTLL